MKRRYKLLIILSLGALITFLITRKTDNKGINLVAIGDGLSLGLSDKQVHSLSFNDYLKEYLENNQILNNYNNEFSIYNLTLSNLNYYLETNKIGDKSKKPIKQIIAKADILTIAIGIDEYFNFDTLSINEYNKMLKTIRTFYDKEIFIIGLYPIQNKEKNIIYDINIKIRELATKYNANYIDIFAYSLNKDNYINNNTCYLNYKAHEKIYKQIVKENNYLFRKH